MKAARSMRVLVPVLALGLMAWSTASVRAEEAVAAKGTISGKVVTDAGSPAANVEVKLVPAKAHKDKQATEPTEKKGKKAPVAETTTDKDGAFTFADVPVGSYNIVAGDKAAGAKEKVEITSGKNADVTLTLKAHTADAGGDKHDKKHKHDAN